MATTYVQGSVVIGSEALLLRPADPCRIAFIWSDNQFETSRLILGGPGENRIRISKSDDESWDNPRWCGYPGVIGKAVYWEKHSAGDCLAYLDIRNDQCPPPYDDYDPDALLTANSFGLPIPLPQRFQKALSENSRRRSIIISYGSAGTHGFVLFGESKVQQGFPYTGISQHDIAHVLLRYCDLGEFVRQSVWIDTYAGLNGYPMVTEVCEVCD